MSIPVVKDTGTSARDAVPSATTDGRLVPIDDLLHLLEPLQQRIVRLIYLEGLSPDATAQVLAVERVVVATSLAVAFRRIARQVIGDHDHVPALAPRARTVGAIAAS